MARLKSTSYFWFRAFLVVGAVLGTALLVQSVRNYNFVSNSLIREELLERADREGDFISFHLRSADVTVVEELGPAIQDIVNDSDEVAWVRVISDEGEVIASGGSPLGEPLTSGAPQAGVQPSEPLEEADETSGPPSEPGESGPPDGPRQSDRRTFDIRGSGAQRVLVTLSQLRSWGQGGRRFPGRGAVPGPFQQPPQEEGDAASTAESSPESDEQELSDTIPAPRQPRAFLETPPWQRGAMLEIALYWRSADSEFIGDLRRNLIIQVSAAIALLGAMVFLGLRFPSYMHGKQLEQQLALARSVQQTLLPSASPDCGRLDVAARCDPAWQVGGDFYDVFVAQQDRVAMLLGDVSGKGLPASLLMGLVHGAVRSSSWAGSGVEHEEASRSLNDLLCMRTTVERFASLFWCYYDPHEKSLRYVNAGHLPPFVLANGNGKGAARLERLEEGGPVLGVIPGADYRQGSAEFNAGDVLVLYSDGVVEAANATDEEFGEERLAQLILENRTRPANEIRDEILRQVRSFVGGEQFQDDLTLLVVRAEAEVTGDDSLARAVEVPELVRAS